MKLAPRMNDPRFPIVMSIQPVPGLSELAKDWSAQRDFSTVTTSVTTQSLSIAPDSSGSIGLPPAPRTELGRRLWEHRRRIVATGAKLLSADEVLREVHERRGEAADEA